MNGELDTLSLIDDTGITFFGHLHVNANELVVQTLDPGQFGRHMIAEAVTHTGVPSLDNDVHSKAPLRLDYEEGTRPADLVFVPTSAC